MKIEKIIAVAEKQLQDARISPKNLVSAIVKLVEVAHKNGLDAPAVAALAECGITLEITGE